MPSSPSEPKGFFDGFTVWDWFAIWVVSDIGSSAIMLLLAGTASWFLVIAPALWWLHLFNVRNEIKNGTR